MSRKKGLTMLLLSMLLCLSCDDDSVAVAFSFPEEVKVFSSEQDGVRITLRLSRESPFEHELHVVNESGQTVSLASKDIRLSLMETAMVVPGVRKYDRFIRKIRKKALVLCNQDERPYTCVDEVNTLAETHLGKGFQFGKLQPGEERQGYIVFNFPGPVTRSTLTKRIRRFMKEGVSFLSGELQLNLRYGAVKHEVAFPVNLIIIEDTENMSIVLKAFWKMRGRS